MTDKITIERETLKWAIRWHESRIWPGPDEVSVFGALRAALAAQPAVLLESTRAWSRAIAQEERACRAEDALVDLVNQIRKTSPIDDHGHDLTMNMAYLKAVELLDDPPQPRKDDHVPSRSSLGKLDGQQALNPHPPRSQHHD